jgi:hypothetical protein
MSQPCASSAFVVETNASKGVVAPTLKHVTGVRSMLAAICQPCFVVQTSVSDATRSGAIAATLHAIMPGHKHSQSFHMNSCIHCHRKSVWQKRSRMWMYTAIFIHQRLFLVTKHASAWTFETVSRRLSCPGQNLHSKKWAPTMQRLERQ